MLFSVGAKDMLPTSKLKYSVALEGVDPSGATTVVKAWDFKIVNPQEFVIAPAWATDRINGKAAMDTSTNVLGEYYSGSTYIIDGPKLDKTEMFENPKNGNFGGISFKLTFNPNSPSSFLVDTSNGKMLFVVANGTVDMLAPGERYTVTLEAVDTGGSTVPVKEWAFRVVEPPKFQTTKAWNDGIRPNGFLARLTRIPLPSATLLPCTAPYG